MEESPLTEDEMSQTIRRSSSPWSSLSSVLNVGLLRPRTISNGYASRIPVLAGNSPRYPSFRFYSDIGDEEELIEGTAPLRFADPPPTLKELHADGHKMNYGEDVDVDAEDDGLGDQADVWNEYCAEAKAQDQELINELNGSLDVLLIFAGLFCAVLAALIIESYKLLRPDPQDDNLAVLQAILLTLQNGSQVIPPYDPNTFQPTSSAVRVNALWFGSLALTLGVAVQVMLAKQWLHKYSEGLSNVPRLRMQLRQYRYDSLRSWALPEMVNFLPTLLHLALALFLLGLVDFLWNINRAVANITLVICLTFASLYVVIMVLPHFFTDCPYKTPFSRLLGLAYYRVRLLIYTIRQEAGPPPRTIPLEHAEYQAIQERRDDLQAKAIAWLMSSSRNPLVIRTITQSLASLTTSFTAIPTLWQAGAIQRVAEQFLSCFTERKIPSELQDVAVQLQLDEERSVEAGLYAKALVGLTEGLPTSRWPQKPPRDLHLYADVLDSALMTLSAQTEDADVVAFAIAGREHVFRAGRNRYPNARSQNPTHNLGELLDLVKKIADDEIIPSTGGVACVVNTVRRCVEPTISEERLEMWNEFARPLLAILAESPRDCRVRLALSKTIACFGGLNHNRDYSEGQNATEHRLIFALSTLLATSVRCARESDGDEDLAEVIARALQSIVAEYSQAVIHSIQNLGDVLAVVLPILSMSQSLEVKRCCLLMVENADYSELPQGSFANLMGHLKDTSQVIIHYHLVRVVERHLHRPEVVIFLADVQILQSILRLLGSPDPEVQVNASKLLLELCTMGFKTGGKGAQRSVVEPLLKAGLLSSLTEFLWTCRAAISSDPHAVLAASRQDCWMPTILAILELYSDEVVESGIMDACIALCQELALHFGQGGTVENLKEWWGRYQEWVARGKGGVAGSRRRPKPRPKGPLYRRMEVS